MTFVSSAAASSFGCRLTNQESSCLAYIESVLVLRRISLSSAGRNLVPALSPIFLDHSHAFS